MRERWTDVENAEPRKHLSLLAAEDVERIEREGRRRDHRQSLATWTADIGFWLVYGGAMALVAYGAFCAPGP